MRDITLQAEVRTQVGKGSRAMRREGKVPGIYYIHGEENIPLAVEEKSLKPLIFTSEAHIVNLKLNTGTDKSCILRSIQFDPVSERAIHFDLQGLRENEEITIEVLPTNDNRSYHVSAEKIKKELGFTPKHTIQHAIHDLKSAFEKGLVTDPFNNQIYYNIKQMQQLGMG